MAVPGTFGKDLGSLSMLSLFESSDRFHLIVNEAGSAKSTDVFFILGKASEEDDAATVITSVYTDEL